MVQRARSTVAAGGTLFRFSAGLGVTRTRPCDDTTDPPGVTILGHGGTHPSPIATTATTFAHDTATGISIASRANVGEIALLDRDDLVTAAIALIAGS